MAGEGLPDATNAPRTPDPLCLGIEFKLFPNDWVLSKKVGVDSMDSCLLTVDSGYSLIPIGSLVPADGALLG